MYKFPRKSTSCPDIFSPKSKEAEEKKEFEKKGKLKQSFSTYGLNRDHKQENDSKLSVSSELYGSDLSDSQSLDHVTVVFNWNYGGNEVYLVEYSENNSRKIKMVKSTNCFTTIQELPRGLFRYRYQVDDVLQYAPEDPFIKTEDGFVNYIDVTNFKATDYAIPRNNQELINSEHFGNDMPGPNYSTMEPPFYPDILNYRSPDFENPNRVSSEIHILANHIYEDTTAKTFLGSDYKSFMCVYRWANELANSHCQPRSVSFIYITRDEYNTEYSRNEELNFLNYFKME